LVAAHVFVADLAQPALGDDDRHHLERVLRLRPGEVVTVSDGTGGWRACRFELGGRLEPVGPLSVTSRPAPAVTVAFALTKGDRPEWTVQKLVEVGVDRIVPLVARHSVVRWDQEKAGRQLTRLRSVALAAAMQSRQVWLPEVAEVQPFAALAEGGPGVALAQMGGDPPGLDRPTILIGPEGGWDDSELASGLAHVTLGPTVLRAETAAVAAAVLLCGLRAGVVGAPGQAGS
jgi:16S rRNA (uracil1498-N3)-methyltransferase